MKLFRATEKTIERNFNQFSRLILSITILRNLMKNRHFEGGFHDIIKNMNAIRTGKWKILRWIIFKQVFGQSIYGSEFKAY